MEKRSRFAGRLIALLLALVLALPAHAQDTPAVQDTLAALAADRGCAQEALLDEGGFTPGDSVSDWIAIAAGRSGERIETDAYRRALTEYVTQMYRRQGGLDAVRATQWQRIALAILALGGDPTCVGPDGIDLIADGSYRWTTTDSLGTQGLNGWIFALIALDSARFAVPQNARYSRQTIVTAILSAQEADGGFGLASGASDVDITAMALQALAPYRNGTVAYALASGQSVTVSAAADRALQWLSAQQTAQGDFISWGSANAESTAQVIIALCALGIDPAADARFCKNGVSAKDGLLRYRLDSGLYAHVLSDGADLMATQQAMLAWLAMQRLADGARSLYDFRPPMEDAVREEIAALNREITEADEQTLRAEADALYARYLALPAQERSYVFALDRLRAVRTEAALTADDPAAAYNLRQPGTKPSRGRILPWLCGAAAVPAGAGLILWKRKRKCTKSHKTSFGK